MSWRTRERRSIAELVSAEINVGPAIVGPDPLCSVIPICHGSLMRCPDELIDDCVV